jgi:hypothetical protein
MRPVVDWPWVEIENMKRVKVVNSRRKSAAVRPF